MSKSVTFDELEGGAIRPDTRVYESAPPGPDYTTVMSGAEFSQFASSPSPFYNDALNTLPKNFIPMSVYDQAAR